MDSCVPPGAELPEFLRDAQRLLSQAQECLLHLQLIDNDQMPAGASTTPLPGWPSAPSNWALTRSPITAPRCTICSHLPAASDTCTAQHCRQSKPA